MKSTINLTKLIKSCLVLAAGTATMSSLTASAAQTKFEQAQSELKIMSNIFSTALSSQSPKKQSYLGSNKVRAIYLADQGMVFNFKFNQHSFGDVENWQEFGEGLGHLVGGIASEVGVALEQAFDAPEAPSMSFDFEDSIGAFDEHIEAMERARETQQQQREKVRELQREVRRLERRRDDNQLNDQAFKDLKNELEQKLDQLKQKMAQYKQSMEAYRQKRAQEQAQNAKLKSDSIIETLCIYGSTLRSVKNSEHITLIFENYIAGKDQIHVFKFESVSECQSKDKLLNNAISYQL